MFTFLQLLWKIGMQNQVNSDAFIKKPSWSRALKRDEKNIQILKLKYNEVFLANLMG